MNTQQAIKVILHYRKYRDITLTVFHFTDIPTGQLRGLIYAWIEFEKECAIHGIDLVQLNEFITNLNHV